MCRLESDSNLFHLATDITTASTSGYWSSYSESTTGGSTESTDVRTTTESTSSVSESASTG